jgi:hypothetical protein
MVRSLVGVVAGMAAVASLAACSKEAPRGQPAAPSSNGTASTTAASGTPIATGDGGRSVVTSTQGALRAA